MIDKSGSELNKKTIAEIKRLIKVLKTRKHVCQVNGIYGEAIDIANKIINLAQQANLKKLIEEEEKSIASMQGKIGKSHPVKMEMSDQSPRVSFLMDEMKGRTSPQKQTPLPIKRPRRSKNSSGPQGINTLIKEVRQKQAPRQTATQRQSPVQRQKGARTQRIVQKKVPVQKQIPSEIKNQKFKEAKAKFKQKETKLMLLLDRLKKDEDHFEKEKIRFQNLLEEEWKTLEAERAQLVGEIEKQKQEFKKYIEKERQALELERAQLLKEREALERDDVNLGTAITQFEQNKVKYKDEENKLNEARVQLENQNAEIENLKAFLLKDRKKLKNKKAQLKNEIDQLKASRLKFEENRIKYENLKGVDAKLEMEIAFIEEEKAALSLEKAKLEKEKIKLKLERNKFKGEKKQPKNA